MSRRRAVARRKSAWKETDGFGGSIWVSIWRSGADQGKVSLVVTKRRRITVWPRRRCQNVSREALWRRRAPGATSDRPCLPR